MLPGISLFSRLDASEIASITQLLIERRYEAGEMLCWEGDPCAGMFLIVQGTVKIFRTSQSGRELVIGLESAPSSVAELPLFDGGPYPASVRGVGDVVTYFINKDDFYRVCRGQEHDNARCLAWSSNGRRKRSWLSVWNREGKYEPSPEPGLNGY